jgi:hypothetical protein
MRAVCLKMVKNIQKPAERRLHNRSTSYAHNVGSAAFDGKDGDSGCLEEGTAVLRGEEARGRGAGGAIRGLRTERSSSTHPFRPRQSAKNNPKRHLDVEYFEEEHAGALSAVNSEQRSFSIASASSCIARNPPRVVVDHTLGKDLGDDGGPNLLPSAMFLLDIGTTLDIGQHPDSRAPTLKQ